MTMSNSPTPAETFTLRDLVTRCEAARDRCSKHNPNRRLWADVIHAMTELAQRLHDTQQHQYAQQPRPGERLGLNVSDNLR